MENITNPIAINAPAHAEMLRTKNEEFIAKYPTDDAQIDYYTELAMEVFDVFEIDGTYSEYGTRANVRVWYENKQAQFALFRKHPYWDEEAKAIIFTQDERRSVNYAGANDALRDLICYLEDKGYSRPPILLALRRTFNDMLSSDYSEVLTEAFINRFKYRMGDYEIPKPIERMLKVGTKITKLVRKCFTIYPDGDDKVRDVTTLVDEHAEGDRNYASFDKYFAKFADYLSELVVKKVTVVSLHFCDFLLMSNGNSWASCHFINSHNIFHEGINSYSGCYKQGCLSYALDEPSFIFYTLPHTYDGNEYHLQPKLNRMCCQYQNGIIITGKLYPNNEVNLITRYRQTLQQIISDVADFPNSWTFSRNVDRILAFVTTDKDSGHYRDYECCEQKPTISIARHGAVLDIDGSMTIGHRAYCVDCGEELYGGNHEHLQCSIHNTRYTCANCGCAVDPDDDEYVYEYNGEYYCSDCCFYCDYHERYEPVTERCDLVVDGYDIYVCEYAKDRYYRQCDECGSWHREDDLCTDGVHYFCADCDAEKPKCSECGAYLNDSDEDMCESCKRIASGEIVVVRCDEYRVGDYVLMKKQFHCAYGQNYDMESYAGRIMRITQKTWSGAFNLTQRANGCNTWGWDDGCFAGKVLGANDDMLFRTLEV